MFIPSTQDAGASTFSSTDFSSTDSASSSTASTDYDHVKLVIDKLIGRCHAINLRN